MSVHPLNERIARESDKQGAFFEGAVVPLVAWYQQGMDYRYGDDFPYSIIFSYRVMASRQKQHGCFLTWAIFASSERNAEK